MKLLFLGYRGQKMINRRHLETKTLLARVRPKSQNSSTFHQNANWPVFTKYVCTYIIVLLKYACGF